MFIIILAVIYNISVTAFVVVALILLLFGVIIFVIMVIDKLLLFIGNKYGA